MRVLIISAILACATAAPSGLLAHAPLVPGPLVSGPLVTPILYAANPGDVQAAVIDAHVQAEDQAREQAEQVKSAVEETKSITEENIEENNEKVRELTDAAIEANDQAREQQEEAFWNAEEQKWQAVDALKTAEGQIDGAASGGYLAGAVVSGGPALAIAQPAFAVAQPTYAVQPLTYTQSVVAPATKTIVTQSLSQTHPAPLAKFVVPETYVAAAPIVNSAFAAPLEKSIVTQYNPAPLIAQPIVKYAEPLVYTSTVIKPETKSIVSSSLSQTHGQAFLGNAAYIQPAAKFISSPLVYSAPFYKSELVASTW